MHLTRSAGEGSWPLTRRAWLYGALFSVLSNVAAAIAIAGEILWPLMVVVVPFALLPFSILSSWPCRIAQQPRTWQAVINEVIYWSLLLFVVGVLVWNARHSGVGMGAQHWSVVSLPVLLTVLIAVVMGITRMLLSLLAWVHRAVNTRPG